MEILTTTLGALFTTTLAIIYSRLRAMFKALNFVGSPVYDVCYIIIKAAFLFVKNKIFSYPASYCS